MAANVAVFWLPTRRGHDGTTVNLTMGSLDDRTISR